MRVSCYGVDTNFQFIGRKEKTLLLLHGWGNNWESWAPLIPKLSARYRLLIPDLPGFGRSGSPKTGWEMQEYVDWLREFLASQKIDQLSAVLGHSFGGKLAAFAWWGEAEFPPVDTGFFLLDPSGIQSKLPFGRRLIRNLAQLVPRTVKRGLLGAFRQRVYTEILKETDYFEATRFQEETLQKILPQDIRDNSAIRDFPLHFCWGEDDQAAPLWMAYDFTPLSSRSDIFVVPQTGHFPHHEKTLSVLQWMKAYGL